MTCGDNHCAIRPFFIIAILIGLMSVGIGCERSPDDLEEWRNASGGMAQLMEWAQDDEESIEVRVRAVQIMVEEGAHDRLPRVFDAIDDEQIRQEMANRSMSSVQSLWNEDDVPELTDKMREEGARVPIDDYKMTRAVDAIYRLAPHLTGDEKQTAQGLLRDWMSRDQELRNQLANTSFSLLLPHAGTGAAEVLSDWLLETHDPREITDSLRNHAPDDAHPFIDAAIGERARKKHPELTNELMHALAGAKSDGIASYLTEAMLDPDSGDDLFQLSINKIVEVSGEDAIEPLAKVVEQSQGIRRWAAASNLIDAGGLAGLIAIANALPVAADSYGATSDDEVHARFVYLCNYLNTNITEEKIDRDNDALSELLAMDEWPAQALGLQCAFRTNATDLREPVQNLRGESTRIPAWDGPKTIGQLAGDVDTALDVADQD